MEVHTTELLFTQVTYKCFCFMIPTTTAEFRITKISAVVYNNKDLINYTRLNMLYLESYFRFCAISRMESISKEWNLRKKTQTTKCTAQECVAGG